MGQNNDPAERGELQGNQGGTLAKDPAEHQLRRQPAEDYALAKSRRRGSLTNRATPLKRQPKA